MSNIKAGARHSAADMQHIASAKSKAAQIMEHMAALGAAEDAPEMKALPMGADPVAFACQECCDIQSAAGALWTLGGLLGSESAQDDDDTSMPALLTAARQIVAYINGELDDIESATQAEDTAEPPAEDMQPSDAGWAPDGPVMVDAGMAYNAKNAPPESGLVYAGDAVKSLANGHVGGYLVRFSSPDDPDLSGEYFTKDTDFGIQSGAKTHVWFHHRGAFKTRDGRTMRVTEPIGEGTLKMDDIGVFVDAVLYNRRQYEQVLNDLGWSSGTASHLVDAEPRGKATWIKRWYLGLDATLTFGPCEPRNAAIPLKSLDAVEIPLSFDTKSKAAPEIAPETGRSPVARDRALAVLVQGYSTLIKHTY